MTSTSTNVGPGMGSAACRPENPGREPATSTRTFLGECPAAEPPHPSEESTEDRPEIDRTTAGPSRLPSRANRSDPKVGELAVVVVTTTCAEVHVPGEAGLRTRRTRPVVPWVTGERRS